MCSFICRALWLQHALYSWHLWHTPLYLRCIFHLLLCWFTSWQFKIFTDITGVCQQGKETTLIIISFNIWIPMLWVKGQISSFFSLQKYQFQQAMLWHCTGLGLGAPASRGEMNFICHSRLWRWSFSHGTFSRLGAPVLCGLWRSPAAAVAAVVMVASQSDLHSQLNPYQRHYSHS